MRRPPSRGTPAAARTPRGAACSPGTWSPGGRAGAERAPGEARRERGAPVRVAGAAGRWGRGGSRAFARSAPLGAGGSRSTQDWNSGLPSLLADPPLLRTDRADLFRPHPRMARTAGLRRGEDAEGAGPQLRDDPGELPPPRARPPLRTSWETSAANELFSRPSAGGAAFAFIWRKQSILVRPPTSESKCE